MRYVTHLPCCPRLRWPGSKSPVGLPRQLTETGLCLLSLAAGRSSLPPPPPSPAEAHSWTENHRPRPFLLTSLSLMPVLASSVPRILFLSVGRARPLRLSAALPARDAPTQEVGLYCLMCSLFAASFCLHYKYMLVVKMYSLHKAFPT